MKSPANPFSFFSMLKILKKSNADIIHTHSSIDSWLCGVAAKLSQIQVVRSRHISIPIKNMFPSFRGRKLDQANFSHDKIEEIAFLIGNKKEEDFKLMIDSIELK